ncbi:MAG: lipocalin family protein [Ferruginibacter sp.]
MKKIILPIALLMSVISCQKEPVKNEPKKCDLTSANLIGSYKITANSYRKDAASPFVDVYASYKPCEKDDLITFASDNTIVFSDAGVKCSPSGDSTGTWALGANTISIDKKVYAVTAYDCTSISGTFTGTTPGELITVTLTKQ